MNDRNTKTRYTNEATFDHYEWYARSGFMNSFCKLGGTFTVKTRFKTELTDDGFRDCFMGRYITCSCPNAHECFYTGSSISVDGQKKCRISSHVQDCTMPVYDRSKAVKIRRTK